MMKRDALTFLTNLRHAWRDPRTPWFARAALIVGVLYVVMPFDAVPDLIPLVGWLDDAAVLPLAWWVFSRLAGRGVRRA